jgi:hypothetical protein
MSDDQCVLNIFWLMTSIFYAHLDISDFKRVMINIHLMFDERHISIIVSFLAIYSLQWTNLTERVSDW